jgi:hypothetical protein
MDLALGSQMRARALATEACQRDPPEGLDCIQSAAYQKDRARIKAFQEWAQDWRRDHADRERGRKPQSFAYSHALAHPPDGNNHPLWQAAIDRERDNRGGRKTKKFRYSRRTTSTALQVAIDHAFTGTYVTRFRPNDPPEAQTCPCGAPLRSPQHITHACYRFHWERAASGINYYGRLVPFRKILGPNKKNAMRLLTFIQESRAFTRPEVGPQAPPEPD